MKEKCKNCGVSIAKFPLKDNMGNFLWKNLFKMSWDSILLIVIIVAMITAYKHDIAKCEEMIEDPLGYCNNTNACRILANQQTNSRFVDPANVVLWNDDINIIVDIPE